MISYVNHFYFDSVDMEKIMDGAFRGLMEELDPHSTYIPAKEQENINEVFKGKFQGIGIEFDILDGFITVISPVPDSPSDIVGLMPGDKLIAINEVEHYSIDSNIAYLKNIFQIALSLYDTFEVASCYIRIDDKPFFVDTKGYDVDLLTTSWNIDYEYISNITGGEKYILDVLGRTNSNNPKIIPKGIFKWIRHNIEKYDVIHVSRNWSLLASIVALMARNKGIPYIYSPMGFIG